jgi:2,3-bisphosphoglycerate-dependent phosphoglycerate mutase
MGVEVVFETHSVTEDNEAGRATGWNQGRLSDVGRDNARALGRRRRDDRLDVVLISDLARAEQTAAIAFEDSDLPILKDWRLRECDYGELNGAPVDRVHDRSAFLHTPYPGGESWSEATARVTGVLPDIAARWGGGRVLVIGHVATRWGLEIALGGASLEKLAVADFSWQEGWEFRIG